MILSKMVVLMAKNLMNNYRSNVPPTVKVRMHCKHYNPCLLAMANMKLMEEIAIHRHVPRMIIVIHDLCKKENNMQKKMKNKDASSREEGKSFGMELKQEL